MSKNIVIIEKLYRIIVELSGMNNNDEYSFCSPTQLKGELKEVILMILLLFYKDLSIKLN